MSFELRDKLEDLLKEIRGFILDKKTWVERIEICEALDLPLNKPLVKEVRNSKIGQVLYQNLRKEGFGYQKVELDPEDKFKYELWVSPPSSDKAILDKILKTRHGENYLIVESKRNSKKTVKIDSNKDESDIDLADCDCEYFSEITDLIKNGENIFITGYAGTGKSFILNKLKKCFRIDVTSTTGLAAVNINGQTIHSWAGVGICNRPIVDVVEKILNRAKLKKQILDCEILAIDEISMLDGVTFDYIDEVLRQVRDCDKPMGGIQMLLFGDFFQLPPVSKERGFCFRSSTWEELDLKTIFLEKIYRQNDERFISALNRLRLNEMSEDDAKLF